MTWELVAQIGVLMALTMVLVVIAHGAMVDKQRGK